MVIIPNMPNQFFYSETVTLDAVAYELEFVWNHRGNYWCVTVSDSDGKALIAGVKVVLEFDLFKRYSKKNIPTGLFIAIRDGVSKAKPTFDELGKTVNIIYIPESEYAKV